jgi:hypothetical protein
MRKLIKKKFNEGDKIMPLPEADLVYPLSGSILEVEHQLIMDHKSCDGCKDTYVHLWRAKDYTVKFRVGRKSFAVDSQYFRLMADNDVADFMLDEL